LRVDAVELAERVFRTTVPVVVWVDSPPAGAAGVGLLLVYAASYSVTSPGAGVGPLLPLDQAYRADAEDPAATRRALDRIEAWTAERGGDASFAEESAAAPAQTVLNRGVVDDVATSLGDLLERIDGEEVPTADGVTELATHPSEAQLRFHDLGIGARVLHATASPVAVYVLLVLGIAGLAFELTQSGIGIAGILGAVAVGFAVYGFTAVPFDPLGLGVLLAGQALLVLDVRLRRLGVLTLAGMAAFVVGSLLVFGEVGPAVDLPAWLVWFLAVAVLLYYGFALTVAQKARERITTTQRGLVGLVGETRGTLAPEGPVFVKGTLWRGRALDGPIPPGTQVRIRRVDGLILRVEPEPPAEEPHGNGG
jgi:membrane-bound serine protease (ClpP class)